MIIYAKIDLFKNIYNINKGEVCVMAVSSARCFFLSADGGLLLEEVREMAAESKSRYIIFDVPAFSANYNKNFVKSCGVAAICLTPTAASSPGAP